MTALVGPSTDIGDSESAPAHPGTATLDRSGHHDAWHGHHDDGHGR